jgi:hypothetical protein
VAQAQLLGRQLLALAARYGDGRRARRADHRQPRGAHLDVAGGHSRVPSVLGRSATSPSTSTTLSRPDGGGGGDHLGARPVRVERHLHDPLAVAQVDEDQGAEVAAPVHPAAERDARAGVLGAQGAAGWVRSEVASGETGAVTEACREGRRARPRRPGARGAGASDGGGLGGADGVEERGRVGARSRASRTASSRSRREIRARARTCAPAALSGPTRRKHSSTGSPSSAS